MNLGTLRAMTAGLPDSTPVEMLSTAYTTGRTDEGWESRPHTGIRYEINEIYVDPNTNTVWVEVEIDDE